MNTDTTDKRMEELNEAVREMVAAAERAKAKDSTWGDLSAYFDARRAVIDIVNGLYP